MSKRVLVVDDEHCIADTLAAILRQAGYDAIAFYDAETALHHCDSFTPDLLITDVVMPGLNGIQLAALLRQRYRDCRILLVSGLAGDADLIVEARSRELELLAKPITPAELLATISSSAFRQPRRVSTLLLPSRADESVAGTWRASADARNAMEP